MWGVTSLWMQWMSGWALQKWLMCISRQCNRSSMGVNHRWCIAIWSTFRKLFPQHKLLHFWVVLVNRHFWCWSFYSLMRPQLIHLLCVFGAKCATAAHGAVSARHAGPVSPNSKDREKNFQSLPLNYLGRYQSPSLPLNDNCSWLPVPLHQGSSVAGGLNAAKESPPRPTPPPTLRSAIFKTLTLLFHRQAVEQLK